MIESTSTVVTAALGIVALLGAVVTWLRWVRPRWRRGARVVRLVTVSLVGRDAITDPATGRVLAPSQPGLGVRMEAVEQAQLETRDAVKGIADLLRSQHTQDERLDRLEHRVGQLEDGAIERVASKAESVAAWRAVEAVAKTGPLDGPQVEDDGPPELDD